MRIRSSEELSTIKLPGVKHGPTSIQYHVERFDKAYKRALQSLSEAAGRRLMSLTEQKSIQDSLEDFYMAERSKFVLGLQPLLGSMLPKIGLQRVSQFDKSIQDLLQTELNIDMHNQHMIGRISQPVPVSPKTQEEVLA